jgi:hypothetical protein
MGAVQVHDRRPGWDKSVRDQWGYGRLLMRTRSRRPLQIGDRVTLRDGASWPVVSTREWQGPLGWKQSVAVGDPHPDRTAQLGRSQLGLAG